MALRLSHVCCRSLIFFVGERDIVAWSRDVAGASGVSVPLREKMEMLRRAIVDEQGL